MIRLGHKLARCFAGFSKNLTAYPGINDNSKQTAFPRNRFSTLPLPRNFDLDIQIKKLDQNVRKTGRISIKDLQEILEEIQARKEISSSQSLLLLRCCGSLVPEESLEVRTYFAKEIWNTLNSLNVAMDISHYNALLRVYLENEHLFSPIEFLENLKSKGFEPNRVTYQRLIRRYCIQGDLNGATQILQFMQEKGLPVNEHVFNALVVGHSQANDIDSAKGILKVMKQAGLEPSTETYVTLMCCLAKHGMVDDIFSTIEECEKNNILVLDKDLLEVVYSLAINSYPERIPEIIGKLEKTRGFNQDCINIILRLISKGHEDIAYELFKVMPRPVSSDNGDISNTGNFFIKHLVKSSRPISKITQFCSDMKNNNYNLKSFEVAYEAGITYKTIDILKFLEAMKENNIEIRQHFFWPVICQSKSEEEIFRILAHMKEHFGIQPSSETLRDYIIPNLKQNDPEQVIESLTKVGVPRGIAAVSTAYWTLSLNKLNMTAKLMENHKTYYPVTLFKNQIVSPILTSEDIVSFVKILNSISLGIKSKESARHFVGETVLDLITHLKLNDIDRIELILEQLLEFNLGITNEFAEKIQNKLETSMNDKLSHILTKLTSIEFNPTQINNNKFESMTVDELETLISKNIYPSKNNYLKRCLINAYFDTKDLVKIENALRNLQETGFEIPTGVKAQLIDLYCNSGKLDEALSLYNTEKSKQSDLSLDRIKTLKLADLILKSGNSEKALQFLKDNKKEVLSDNVSYLYKNMVWKLLNNIAETGNADLLQKVFHVLDENNFIIPSNVILGPLIKVHLKNDNLGGAMEAFTKICEKYRVTPWKNELSCRLIQQEDAVNLQKITDLSTTIHGEVNSLYDLVFSFIECGRIKQARKILETPGLQNRSNRINSACERYRTEGDIKSLEGLVEATSNINYIDKNLIYFNLLQSYQKQNDPQKALNLWTKMQEENIIPTDTFLIRLAKFLKEHNIDIPFVIPSEISEKPNNTQEESIMRVKKSNNGIYDFETLQQFIQEENLSEASKIIADMLSKKINIPHRLLIFYLNKLANKGIYEAIENLKLANDVKKKISFDNRLCNAYIKAGKAKEYFYKLKENFQNCKDDNEINVNGAIFPRGGALGLLEHCPDIYDEYKELAEKYADHGIKGPINVLWIHSMIAGKIQEANSLLEKHLKEEPRLMFQKLLQRARETDDGKLVENILLSVKDTKISEGALGNIYSCALDILTKHGEASKAISLLDEAVKHICLEHFNRTALVRLENLCQKKGVVFPYSTIHAKKNTSSSSSSSSDDDVVEPKPQR